MIFSALITAGTLERRLFRPKIEVVRRRASRLIRKAKHKAKES